MKESHHEGVCVSPLSEEGAIVLAAILLGRALTAFADISSFFAFCVFIGWSNVDEFSAIGFPDPVQPFLLECG